MIGFSWNNMRRTVKSLLLRNVKIVKMNKFLFLVTDLGRPLFYIPRTRVISATPKNMERLSKWLTKFFPHIAPFHKFQLFHYKLSPWAKIVLSRRHSSIWVEIFRFSFDLLSGNAGFWLKCFQVYWPWSTSIARKMIIFPMTKHLISRVACER